MKPASFYVLAEYRLRTNAIGSFVSREEADEYKATLPGAGKGWHVVPVEQPALSARMLTARMRRAGMCEPGADDCADDGYVPPEDHEDDPSIGDVRSIEAAMLDREVGL